STKGAAMTPRRRLLAAVLLAGAALACVGSGGALAQEAASSADNSSTTTPIKHLVVIFQENVSFDHYFGTYPNATNPAGEPAFHPAKKTPSVNGLTNDLLTNNPNAANPKRLDPLHPSDVVTCDQDHGYTDEQKAFDQGKMDKFVESVSGGSCTDKSIVM